MNIATNHRTNTLLAVAQAIHAAAIVPTESGRKMVGLAKAAKLAVAGDEPGLALVAVTALDALGKELEDDGETIGAATAGKALRRRVDLLTDQLAPKRARTEQA